MNNGFDGKYRLQLCQVFQSITTVVLPVLIPVDQTKLQLARHSVRASIEINREHLTGIVVKFFSISSL